MFSINQLFNAFSQPNKNFLFHNVRLARRDLLSNNSNNIKISPHTRWMSQNQIKLQPNIDPRKSQLNPNSNKTIAEKVSYYGASIVVAMFAASFAAVPLYKIYCNAYGKGGQAVQDDSKEEKILKMKKDTSRMLTISFDANTHSSMDWNFKPLQDKVKVHPGETALAFYRATNPLDETVIGVATYTVLPYEAGQYFNKIQCFCFEEQMLKPHEDVFMPVLFYVDPEYTKDATLANVNDLVLSYTFFRSKDGELPDLD